MSQLNIQATRSAAAAGAAAIIAPPVRVYSISIACSGGAGVLELTTTSNSGTTKLYIDVPTGEILTLNFGGGILFEEGIYLDLTATPGVTITFT